MNEEWILTLSWTNAVIHISTLSILHLAKSNSYIDLDSELILRRNQPLFKNHNTSLDKKSSSAMTGIKILGKVSLIEGDLWLLTLASSG